MVHMLESQLKSLFSPNLSQATLSLSLSLSFLSSVLINTCLLCRCGVGIKEMLENEEYAV